jgi:hypothetical protein
VLRVRVAPEPGLQAPEVELPTPWRLPPHQPPLPSEIHDDLRMLSWISPLCCPPCLLADSMVEFVGNDAGSIF